MTAWTWLILPVVICLSQRLSHACLSISFCTAKLRMAHYNSYNLFDGRPTTWTTVVILELIHEPAPDFVEGWYLLDTEPTQALLGFLVIHDNWMNCTASAGNDSFKFLTYQLPTVGYWPTVAMTGNGELGFDSGEGAWETATTSKEGSRRANYPILTQGGSDKK